MKRFTIVLAVVLALAVSSTALARGPGKHHHGPRGPHHVSRHHGHHGPHRRPPVIRVHRPPVVRIYTPPVVYYPPYYYGCRSAEAELAIGIGQIVGAAIDLGR